MYKLILVDDDVHTIEGIKRHIPLNELEIELVATANNGRDGIAEIKKYRPDIVFSDVQMPLMSGFEMINCMKELAFSPQIIMFTGYNSLDNAKLAINANVCAYLTKPTTPDEIIEALKKAVSSCKEQEKAHKAFSRQLADNLMHGYSYQDSELAGFENRYSVNLHTGFFACLRLSFPTISDVENIPYFADFLAEKFNILQGTVSDKTVCFIISSKNHFTCIDVENYLISKISQWNIFVTIGKVTENIRSITDSYSSAKELQEYSFCFNNKGVLSHETAEKLFAAYCTVLPTLDIPTLQLAVTSANTSEIVLMVKKLEDSLLKCKIYDTLKIKTIIFEFAKTVALLSSDYASYSEDDLNDIWLEIKAITSHNELFDYCYGIASNIANQSAEKININAIIQYIENNYMNQISLTSLSHKTYCSRNYLSTVFKESLGMDFTSYLQDFRMKKAAELLLGNQDTLSAIAEKVGYHDIKTFRRIFEKHYGMLPSEFRQKNS